MTNDDLEARLRAHYRAIDPGRAPGRLSAAASRPAEVRVVGPAVVARRRTAMAGIAAVAVVAVVFALGLRPGGFLVGTGTSPTPSASPTASRASPAPSSSPAPSPTPSPTIDVEPVDLAGSFPGGGLWAVSGSTLFVSTDHGASWRQTSMPTPTPTRPGILPTVFVLDAEHAWTVTAGPGTIPKDYSVLEVLRLVVHWTADGGRTWQESSVPGRYGGTDPAIVFVDPEHGFILCAPHRFGPGSGTVLRTDDGGATWSVAGSAPGIGRLFTASDTSTLWAGGQPIAGGQPPDLLDVSHDGGRTWGPVALPKLTPSGAPSDGGRYLAGPPRFLDPSTGFVTVVGSTTEIYETSDGGRTWSLDAARPQEASAGAATPDGRHWLLPVENPVGLLRTSDGGTTWQPVATRGLGNDDLIVWIGGPDAMHVAALTPIGNRYPGPATLYLSDDYGTAWHPADLAAAAAPSPSAVASPSSTVPACRADQLDGDGGFAGGADTQLGGINIWNTSDTTCRLEGIPGIQIVDATGHALDIAATATTSPPPQPVILGPHQTAPVIHVGPTKGLALVLFTWFDWCAPAPTAPFSLTVTLPEGGVLHVPVTQGSETPPCLHDARGSTMEVYPFRTDPGP